jgi:protein tyrosine phosphatase
MYRKKNNETIFIAEKDSIERKDESGPISRYFRKRKFQKRVAEYEKHEVKAAVKQCLQKVENIKAEAETRTSLIKEMVFPKMEFSYHTGEEHSLRNKYGEQLINSLVDGVICGEPIPAYLTKYYALEYERLKPRDPLINWFIPSAEHTYELISRIQGFAAYIARQVKFSLLIEPGHFRAHLSAFSEQFNDLQCFFDCVELTPEEVSQRAFDANRLSKARNQKVECIDHSRVILHRAEEILNKIAGSNVNSNFLKPSDIFGDLDIPQFHPCDAYGTDDFIHANYVAGGPLANKFICTQAPMKNTMNDFWRMVYQEQPSYIFMLCDAVDIANQGAMGTEEVDHCPVYWPKIPGSSIDYGAIVVKNVGVDGITDPLFTITKLEIFYSTAPSHVITVEHYRWDWQDYHDIHWPLRLLQKSRQSTSRPTIVHCVDGCGKTGTLVYIEVLLMQLLRGTENYEHPLLTCAVFVRLQRRYAIENYMQYLYACRVLLHFVQPFIESKFHRYVLGYSFVDSGFIGRFEDLLQTWAQRTILQ